MRTPKPGSCPLQSIRSVDPISYASTSLFVSFATRSCYFLIIGSVASVEAWWKQTVEASGRVVLRALAKVAYSDHHMD
jgi:hypothetical protein